MHSSYSARVQSDSQGPEQRILRPTSVFGVILSLTLALSFTPIAEAQTADWKVFTNESDARRNRNAIEAYAVLAQGDGATPPQPEPGFRMRRRQLQEGGAGAVGGPGANGPGSGTPAGGPGGPGFGGPGGPGFGGPGGPGFGGPGGPGFGGPGGPGFGGPGANMSPEMRERLRQKFKNMTPEQRKEFRQRFRQGMVPDGMPPGGAPDMVPPNEGVMPGMGRRMGGIGRRRGMGGMQGGMGGMGMGGARAPLNLALLNLTEEQKNRIQQMRSQSAGQAREIRRTLNQKKMEMRDMMFDPGATDEQIKAKRAELRRLQDKAEDVMINDFLSIRSVLTAEQRKRLPELKPVVAGRRASQMAGSGGAAGVEKAVPTSE